MFYTILLKLMLCQTATSPWIIAAKESIIQRGNSKVGCTIEIDLYVDKIVALAEGLNF